MNIIDDIMRGLSDLAPSDFVAMLRASSPESTRFVGETRKLSPAATSMQAAAEGLKSLIPTTRGLPSELRAAGIKAVPGYDVLQTGVGATNVTRQQRNRMLDNLEALVNSGDPNFYIDANSGLARMVPGMPVQNTALLTAPFSAGTDVGRNLELAARFFENPAAWPGRTGAATRTTGPMYKKALKLMAKENPTIADLSEAGEIIKIGSFGENLADPIGSMRATIDRHAVKAPLGFYVSKGPDLQNPRTYRFFEDLYKEVAKKYDMTPSQAQSAVWDAWRRITQINEGGMLSPDMFTPVTRSPLFDLPTDARAEAVARIMQAAEADAVATKAARK
jgi:hypothetical protein